MKLNEAVQQLLRIVASSRIAEGCYRSALTSMRAGQEQMLFIYFWQEHARMVSEVEEKVRWLGGKVPELPQPVWGSLPFKSNPCETEITQALVDCKQADGALWADYTYALKHALPLDAHMLLKKHVLKLETLQARLLKVQSIHHTGRMRMDLHAGDSQDRVLGEVVLQA